MKKSKGSPSVKEEDPDEDLFVKHGAKRKRGRPRGSGGKSRKS